MYYACILWMQKALDYANYWKLFTKLLQDNIDSNIVGLLAYWCSNQELCVRWISSMSASNGTQHGGISSFLFCC